MVKTRCYQLRSHYMATHSSQFPQSCLSPLQWCCSCRHQEWLCPPHRPRPPLRVQTSLGWKEICFFELWWCNNCFELHNIILKASLSDVFVMKANNFTSKYGSPPSRPDLSSTIYTMSCSFCPHHRTPQGCHWSQKGSDSVSLWQQLQCDEEQDESLPVEGKGGILQLVFAGKTSTSVLIPRPPVIIRPAQWKI